MPFEQQHLAEPRKHFANGEEIRVPTSILEHAKDEHSLRRHADQFVGFIDGHRERLVDDDMPSGLERLLRDRKMARVRRSDDYQLGLFDQLFDRVQAIRHIARCEHGRQLHPLACADQRRVEYRSGEAVADKTNADHIIAHRRIIAREICACNACGRIGNAASR